MGNTFEIHSWQRNASGDYGWKMMWGGEDKDTAFIMLESLKASGSHPCLRLDWR